MWASLSLNFADDHDHHDHDDDQDHHDHDDDQDDHDHDHHDHDDQDASIKTLHYGLSNDN